VNRRDRVDLPDVAAIGALVSSRRRQLNMTLTEAAQRMGVGRRMLIELEHGKRAVRLDTLLRVLNLLGFDLIARSRGEALGE
jgi:HTH-type transcriptional regulator / antitoxin HipB